MNNDNTAAKGMEDEFKGSIAVLRGDGMRHIIKSLQKTYRLYNQPHNIGDLIEFEQKQWIIIGIEAISINFDKVKVIYTIQNAEESYVYPPEFNRSNQTFAFEKRIRTGKKPVLETIQPGRVFWVKGKPYQSIGFTDISIEFTDIVIGFEGRLVQPIPTKEVRGKVLNERKKKLNLQVL